MKKYIDLVIGCLFITYYVLVNMLSNKKISFSEVFLLLGISLVLYHFTKEKLMNIKYIKKIIKIFKIIIVIGIMACIFIESAIVLYPKNNREKSDYILVLGAGLNNRSEISATLGDRLNKSIEIYKETGEESYIVVSGGQGADEDISEAAAMKGYLIKKGIPEEKIVEENKSTSTYENFKFSRGIIEEHSKNGIKESKIKVVTTDFHALRSNLIAKRTGYGEVNHYTSKSIWYLIPTNYTREIFALVKTFIMDR